MDSIPKGNCTVIKRRDCLHKRVYLIEENMGINRLDYSTETVEAEI